MIVSNLVTLKAAAKKELQTEAGLLITEVTFKRYDSVTNFMSMIIVNFVTSKAAAKHELLFNKLWLD
jgi:hypothetical protein